MIKKILIISALFLLVGFPAFAITADPTVLVDTEEANYMRVYCDDPDNYYIACFTETENCLDYDSGNCVNMPDAFLVFYGAEYPYGEYTIFESDEEPYDWGTFNVIGQTTITFTDNENEVSAFTKTMLASVKENIFGVISANVDTIVLILVGLLTIFLVFRLVRNATMSDKGDTNDYWDKKYDNDDFWGVS